MTTPNLDEIFSVAFLSDVASSDTDREHLSLLMEAFFIMRERNAKYHDLWKQYGAVDSYHHVTSKAARCQFYLEGTEDESDPFDLINYTGFMIRNIRAGRMHNTAERRVAIGIAGEDIRAGDEIIIDPETGKVIKRG